MCIRDRDEIVLTKLAPQCREKLESKMREGEEVPPAVRKSFTGSVPCVFFVAALLLQSLSQSFKTHRVELSKV